MRILVVEDDPKIGDFLQKGLSAECFSVDLCVNGDDAYDLIRMNEYDVIILDNLLPGKSGFDVCSLLRAEGCSTPILMLSVQSETNDKIRALDAGADDYLTKPFSLQELVARIRALLRRPHQVEGDVLEIHDLVLDTKRHVVTKKKKELSLTKKEIMLLEYFMRNPGVVLTRSMIMEHVWDINADPFSNTIESHILSLRKKIGSTKKDPVIITVPGRGYKIE